MTAKVKMSAGALDEKEPVWVHCEACTYEWVQFFTPLPAEMLKRFNCRYCPKCFTKDKIMMGRIVKPYDKAGDDGKSAGQKIAAWFLSGDTGASSKELARVFLGSESDEYGINHPHDPADLGRCLRLIQRVPEVRVCVDSLALESKQWAKLAPVWDKLAQSMADEVGIDWSKGRSAPWIIFILMLEA